MEFPLDPKVRIFEDSSYGNGIISTCDIPKGNIISIYRCVESSSLKSDTLMSINVDGRIFDGVNEIDNKFELGQFANDAAYTPEIREYLLKGDISIAQELYTQNTIKFINCATDTILNKLVIISTKNIPCNTPVYISYGLAYWIYILNRKNKLIINNFDKFNRFSLEHPEYKYQIFYSSKISRSHNLAIVGTRDGNNTIGLVNDSGILTHEYCLGILCNLFKLHVVFNSMDLLPEWIKLSPYSTLLYWKIIMDVIPKDNKIEFIKLYQGTIEEKQTIYSVYISFANKYIFNNKKDMSKYVSLETFIKYFSYFIDLEKQLNKCPYLSMCSQ